MRAIHAMRTFKEYERSVGTFVLVYAQGVQCTLIINAARGAARLVVIYKLNESLPDWLRRRKVAIGPKPF
jgi:hypothetical protein